MKSWLTKLNNSIIFRRISVLAFITIAVFGWAISVQEEAVLKSLNTQLENKKFSKEQIKQLSLDQKKEYLTYLNKNSKKLISYEHLLKKIQKGEYVSVDYVNLNDKQTNSLYVVDMYNDKTNDYINNKTLYDEFLDTSAVKTFENKTIFYKDKKIILIKEIK